MWIVLGASGMAAVLTGDLVARVGLARAWITGMLLLAAATATIGLVPGSFLAIFSGAAVFGAVYIALTGELLVWATRLFPDLPAFGVGAPFLLVALGQAVAAPWSGCSPTPPRRRRRSARRHWSPCSGPSPVLAATAYHRRAACAASRPTDGAPAGPCEDG